MARDHTSVPHPPVDGAGMRIALAVARFNRDVTATLLEGATRALAACAVDGNDVAVEWVPGAFELPLAATALARTGAFDAVVCLGVVIRGETSHYEHVAAECAAGIQRAQLDTGVPVMFGVLTTEDLPQAQLRADLDGEDKGGEVARGAVEMVELLRRIDKRGT